MELLPHPRDSHHASAAPDGAPTTENRALIDGGSTNHPLQGEHWRCPVRAPPAAATSAASAPSSRPGAPSLAPDGFGVAEVGSHGALGVEVGSIGGAAAFRGKLAASCCDDVCPPDLPQARRRLPGDPRPFSSRFCFLPSLFSILSLSTLTQTRGAANMSSRAQRVAIATCVGPPALRHFFLSADVVDVYRTCFAGLGGFL